MEKKQNKIQFSIDDSYFSIDSAIAFLESQNSCKYTVNDIDDFVSRGRLTPCLPYNGKLFRIFEDELYEYDDLSETEIDGFITPLDRDITCKLGKLLSTEKVFFLNAKIPFKPMVLQDFGAMEYRSRWSGAPYETLESLGTLQKTVNEYQVTCGVGLYGFSEDAGIEIQYHVYRSHVAFHLSQLDGFSEIPKSAKDNLLNQIKPELEILDHKVKQKSTISLEEHEKESLVIISTLIELILKKSKTTLPQMSQPIRAQGILSGKLEDIYNSNDMGMSSSKLNKIFADANTFRKKEQIPKENNDSYNLFLLSKLVDFILNNATVETKSMQPKIIETETDLIVYLVASFKDRPYISKTGLNKKIQLSLENKYLQ